MIGKANDESVATVALTKNHQSSVPRRPSDYLALAIATCGVGYLPIAPGTWGSLVGVGLYFLVQFATFRLIWLVDPHTLAYFSPWPILLAVQLMLITVVTLVGIWAASRAEKLFGHKDPGKVVIDEVAGQLIALLPISPWMFRGWIAIIAAFLLFRLFDIVKPYPARRFEDLEAGLGIMSDDVVAGAYAAVGVAMLIAIGLITIY